MTAERYTPSGPSEKTSLPTTHNRIDLHSHTTASDGRLTPTELVAHADSVGLKVLAITDHDTTEGLAPAQAEAKKRDIVLVPGVEISSVSGREEIHLLGYFIDVGNKDLQELLSRTRAARRERAQKMLVRLANLGMSIEWDRVVEHSGGGGSIGRPHVAATLLEAGHVSSWDEAFSLWIGRDGPAYVERYKLLPEEAIQLIRGSGGLPVLAHPYSFSRTGERRAGLDLKRWLPRLRDAGLAGIEVYYPFYPRHACRQLLAMATEHGLLATGGSDYHGGMLGKSLGCVAVPWAVWEGLERRRGKMLSEKTRPELVPAGQVLT
ncbi:PHP domain-containing protein [Chloroflexota bacterium]